jgi:hypothetical protein
MVKHWRGCVSVSLLGRALPGVAIAFTRGRGRGVVTYFSRVQSSRTPQAVDVPPNCAGAADVVG